VNDDLKSIDLMLLDSVTPIIQGRQPSGLSDGDL